MTVKKNIAFYKKFDTVIFEIIIIKEFEDYEFHIYDKKEGVITRFHNSFKPSDIFKKGSDQRTSPPARRDGELRFRQRRRGNA